MKRIKAILSAIVPTKTDVGISKALAIRGDPNNARNEPKRAKAISVPIASAISLPLNHFTIILDTVIPAPSAPTQNNANPAAEINTLESIPMIVEPISKSPANA